MDKSGCKQQIQIFKYDVVENNLGKDSGLCHVGEIAIRHVELVATHNDKLLTSMGAANWPHRTQQVAHRPSPVRAEFVQVIFQGLTQELDPVARDTVCDVTEAVAIELQHDQAVGGLLLDAITDVLRNAVGVRSNMSGYEKWDTL